MNSTDTRPVIDWTPEMLRRFKRAHGEAVAQRRAIYTFDGHQFVTSYAKYLIEYLTQQLES